MGWLPASFHKALCASASILAIVCALNQYRIETEEIFPVLLGGAFCPHEDQVEEENVEE